MKNQAENIKIPANAKTALEILEKAGHKAYLVGGFVRDQIRNQNSEAEAAQDIDIATSATPTQTEQVFGSQKWTTYPLGKKFGTIGVLPPTKTLGALGSEANLNIKSQSTKSKQDVSVPTTTFASDPKIIEITTFRTEATYTDSRHPDSVKFATTIDEDLARRDFTCNAIACDIRGKLTDPFGGIDDIHNNVIRCVGEPAERFGEDHLRILRALRFASQLGFGIDEKTERAIRDMKDQITKVSGERLRDELTKLICGPNAKEVLTIYSDVIFEVLPELAPLFKYDQKTKYHSHDAWEHTLIVLDKMPTIATITNDQNNKHTNYNDPQTATEIGRWAALLHDIGKPNCQTIDDEGQAHYYGHPEESVKLAGPILRRLKFSNKMRDSILLLIRFHDRQMAATKKSVKKMLRHFADVNTQLPTDEMFRIYCDLRRADSYAHDENFRGYLTFTNQIQTVFEQILSEDEAFQLRDLAIGGQDIISLGVDKGPKISEILSACLDAVINEEIPNTHDALLTLAKSLIH